MKIAYGSSRLSRRWVNDEISFEELCERFRTTHRTPETVAEYKDAPKERRDALKDVGGYVLGHLRGGRRKKDTVVVRSGITLDADHATNGFIDTLKKRFPYRCAVYSTHSHTPQEPRLRVVIPFTRDVSPDEYVTLSRLAAEVIGVGCFDERTHEPERLMYWPSTPADGEYIFKVLAGEVFDPDAYLTTETIEREARRQQDPLEKSGIVGAFCRAYPIEAAIETFLPDVYAPSATCGRYDYIPADSSAGVVLYDGRWAYSHHATDPVCGRLLNAFDLVRLHRFPHLDEREGFKAMSELAAGNARVVTTEHSDWRTLLTRTKSGAVAGTLGNLLLILSSDEDFKGIRYNRLAHQVYGSDLPWERPHAAWRDVDTAQLVACVESRYGLFSARSYELALAKVADDRAYHPVRTYLDELPEWDGRPRVSTLLVDYLGAENTPYVRSVTRKTLVAAVARILSPGAKLDSILVLNGPQGIGKSMLFAKLGGQWYSDSLSISDMRDKTAPEKLQGYWILELGELAGIRKMDVETVKSFITRADDKYRPAYGRAVESHPRGCVIVGTTNTEGGFLRDITGNRRFWPVWVSGKSERKVWDLTEVDQIWAETLVMYAAGEKLFLEGDIALAAIEEQRNAMEGDEREGLVIEYLDTLLPARWPTMSVQRRVEYIHSGDDLTREIGTVVRTQVCVMEIWCECFGRPRDAIKRTDSYEIQGILSRLDGWERQGNGRTGRQYVPMYGTQQVFARAGDFRSKWQS